MVNGSSDDVGPIPITAQLQPSDNTSSVSCGSSYNWIINIKSTILEVLQNKFLSTISLKSIKGIFVIDQSLVLLV